MKSTSGNKVSEEPLNYLNEDKFFELDKKLEELNYETLINTFKNMNLLRTLLINRPKVTFDYIHFLGKELIS